MPVIPLISPYLRWLQQDNPTGNVETYPQIDGKYESSVKGLYIIGDLTGIPLLKMASESGVRVVRNFLADPSFREKKGRGARDSEEGPWDVVIVGAGPAGVACALECEKQGLAYIILESNRMFQTIENFPKGKPILAKPDDFKQESQLLIGDGTKESLLEDLRGQLAARKLQIQGGFRVQSIRRQGSFLEVNTGVKKYRGLRVVVAIGKSGDARKMNVPGGDSRHVLNRLFDPAEYHDLDILVIGGGDTALEASVALAQAGNRVTHSYRKDAFERPKPENLEQFETLAKEGRIKPLFASKPVRIGEKEAVLKQGNADVIVKADLVFPLIGRELPTAFLKRCGIRMEGEKDKSWYVFLAAMLSFFTMLYFGKAGMAVNLFAGTDGILEKAWAYLTVPFTLHPEWGLERHAWYSSLNFYLGWMGSVVFLVAGSLAFWNMLKARDTYFGNTWSRLKYGYLIAVAVFFTCIYFTSMLGQNAGWVESPTYWYSLFYCTTMALFAARRVQVKKSRYIKIQMATLVFIQVFFLFLLPFYLFDSLIKPNFSADSYLLREMFPAGKWSSFGYILFWPLNMADFGKSTFWTWFPLVQTFGILFLLVQQFGKGAYCGWICSCGGMAETLGDEYRTLAPHGPKAKNMDNIGQFVLLFAVAVTVMGYFSRQFAHPSLFVETFQGIYKMSVDVFFAGVLGLGVYFFWGGRIWCRYGCPLAALMHIYSRFSVYRIFAEKKKCISCNICTKVCHMGIDVMGYAAKGIPMNDVQCVRCSACVNSCPTEVLGFGSIKEIDSGNRLRQAIPEYSKEDWRAGIR